MVTRTYCMPNNDVSRLLLNSIFSRVGCSIGEITTNPTHETIRVPITCEEKDIRTVERILKLYGIIGDAKK